MTILYYKIILLRIHNIKVSFGMLKIIEIYSYIMIQRKEGPVFPSLLMSEYSHLIISK